DMTKEQQKEIEPLMNEIASIYHDNPFLKERILQKYDVLTKNIAEIKESGGGINLQLKEEFQVLTDAIQAFYITDIDKLKEILRLLKREKHILSSSPVDVTDEIKLRQGVLSGLTSSVAGGEPYPGAALFIFSRVPKRDNPNLAASPVGFSFESRVVSPESSLPLINSRPMTHILRLPGASSPVENRALEVDTAANGRLMVEACFNQPVKGMVRLAFFDVQKQAIGYADILLDCYLFNYLYVNSKFRSKGFSELMMAVKFKLIEDGWVSKELDFTMFHSYARNPLTARSLMQFGYEPQAFSTAYNFSTTLVIGERTADNKRGIYIADPVKRENFKHYVADNPQDYGIFYLVDRSIDGVQARIYANYYLTDKEKYQKHLAHFGIKHITEIKGSHIVGNSAASSPAEIYSVQEFILPDGEIIKRDVSRIYLDLKRYLQAAKREVAQMIRAHDWRVWNKCSSEEDIPDSASIGRKLSLLNQAMENTYLIGGMVRYIFNHTAISGDIDIYFPEEYGDLVYIIHTELAGSINIKVDLLTPVTDVMSFPGFTIDNVLINRFNNKVLELEPGAIFDLLNMRLKVVRKGDIRYIREVIFKRLLLRVKRYISEGYKPERGEIQEWGLLETKY
ncbi:MAG: hypothetical protein QME65_05105, partial [Candidatus Omnitrophota bacterium]|nr:hypothetical protein [Candidatus Omnitrophota bacterium]